MIFKSILVPLLILLVLLCIVLCSLHMLGFFFFFFFLFLSFLKLKKKYPLSFLSFQKGSLPHTNWQRRSASAQIHTPNSLRKILRNCTPNPDISSNGKRSTCCRMDRRFFQSFELFVWLYVCWSCCCSLFVWRRGKDEC